MDANSTLALLIEKRALLHSVFDYETSDSYYNNLFALSALLLVSLALVVFVRRLPTRTASISLIRSVQSLVCRKQTPNSLWLFRRESTRYGTFYQWHSLIGWLFCSAIFIFSQSFSRRCSYRSCQIGDGSEKCADDGFAIRRCSAVHLGDERER